MIAAVAFVIDLSAIFDFDLACAHRSVGLRRAFDLHVLAGEPRAGADVLDLRGAREIDDHRLAVARYGDGVGAAGRAPYRETPPRPARRVAVRCQA